MPEQINPYVPSCQTSPVCGIRSPSRRERLLRKIRQAQQECVVDPKKAKDVARDIEREDGVQIENEKLKCCLVDGIEAQASAIEAVKAKPDDGTGKKQEAAEKLGEAVASNLEAAKKIVEKGSDQNLTPDDKEAVAQNIQNSAEKTKAVTNNSWIAPYLGSATYSLYHWVYGYSAAVSRMLTRWDMKAKFKRLSKIVEFLKSKFYKVNERKITAKAKAIGFYEKLHCIKSEIAALLGIIHREESRSEPEHIRRFHFAKGELNKQLGQEALAKTNYASQSSLENYCKGEEDKIRSHMPASYPGSMYDLGLDMIG